MKWKRLDRACAQVCVCVSTPPPITPLASQPLGWGGWRGRERGVTALADLEEAMSGVSLSQPEGGALRDVHVRGFRHALVDPGDTNQVIRWF